MVTVLLRHDYGVILLFWENFNKILNSYAIRYFKEMVKILKFYLITKKYYGNLFKSASLFLAIPVEECFSTCGPWPNDGPQSILLWATEHFGKSRILKKSCLNFLFSCRAPVFGLKNRFNLLQN